MTIENISATPGVPTQKSKPAEVKEFTPPKDTIWDHPVATKFWTEKQDTIKKVFTGSSQTETLSWSLKNDLATLAVVPGLTLVDLIKRLDPIKKTKTDEWVIDQGSLSSGSFGIRPRSDLARLIQVYLILEKVGVSKKDATPPFESIDGTLGRFTEKSIATFQLKLKTTEDHRGLKENIRDLRSEPFQNWMKSEFNNFLTENVRAGKGVETLLTKNAQINFLKNGTVEMQTYDLTVIYSPSSSSLDVILPNKQKVTFPVSFPLTVNKDTNGVLIMGDRGNTANIQKMFRYAALFGFTHSNYIGASAKNPAEKFSISRFNRGITVDTKNNALRDTNLLSESSTDALMVDESARMAGKRLQVQTINPIYASKITVLGNLYKDAEDIPEDLNNLKDMSPQDIVNFLNRMLELSKPKVENERVVEQNRKI